MNICFAKVTLPWPHLFLDTDQRKHATWGEGETTDGGGGAMIFCTAHIDCFLATNNSYIFILLTYEVFSYSLCVLMIRITNFSAAVQNVIDNWLVDRQKTNPGQKLVW